VLLYLISQIPYQLYSCAYYNNNESEYLFWLNNKTKQKTEVCRNRDNKPFCVLGVKHFFYSDEAKQNSTNLRVVDTLKMAANPGHSHQMGNLNDDRSPPAVRKRFRQSNENPTAYFFGNPNESNIEGKYVRITGETKESLIGINPIVLTRILDNLAAGFTDCRRNRDGQITFMSRNAQQAKNLIGKKKLQISPTNTIVVEFSMIDSLNCSRGTIFGSDLVNIPIDGEDALLPHLKKDGVIAIERIKTRGKDGNLEFRGLHVLTFDRRNPPPEIKVGFLNYTVKEWIPSPMKCQFCLEFGHTKNRCSKGIKLCRKCNNTEHEDQCHVIKCHSCHPPNDVHESFSANCPVMKKEKRICQEKVARNVSFPEARKIVEEELKNGFVDALRKGINENREEINKIDEEQKIAEMVLEELQRKVEKLKKTKQMIQQLRQQESELLTQNSEMAYGLEFTDDDSEMQFESENEDESDSQTVITETPLENEQKKTTSVTEKLNQKRVSVENRSFSPKKYDLRNSNAPKIVTAEIHNKFNEATITQYNKFVTANPRVAPHYIKSPNGKFTICGPVFSSQ
jgi:hypothetical protein